MGIILFIDYKKDKMQSWMRGRQRFMTKSLPSKLSLNAFELLKIA